MKSLEGSPENECGITWCEWTYSAMLIQLNLSYPYGLDQKVGQGGVR